MYFHCRETGSDFFQMVQNNRHKFTTGVIHSFNGELDEMLAYVKLGLYISISGHSLRRPDRYNVIKEVPLNRLVLETYCPYCDISNSEHEEKGRVQTKFPVKLRKDYRAEDPRHEDVLVHERNEPC